MNKANHFGKVALLFGGGSAERAVSLESGKAVLAALMREGVDVTPIDTLVQPDQPHFIDVLRAGQFDCAFIILHGTDGEDGRIQAVLELLNIPYTGSGVAASALAMDKVRSKFVFQALGLPTPVFSVAKTGEAAEKIAEVIGYPVSVKPTTQGSSVGVSKVDDPSALPAAFALAAQYGEVMVEKWIEGVDFFVSVVNGESYPSVELRLASGFYTYQAKYHSTNNQYFCPARVSVSQEQELRKLALDAFQALGCVHWGRVDFVQDSDGKFWILEVNTLPGMTNTSLVPKSALVMGLSFDQLVIQILSLARPVSIGMEVSHTEQYAPV